MTELKKTNAMDRVFTKEELGQALKMQVVERNDLITNARHNLSARELKIMDFLISKVKPDDEDFILIETSANQIGKVLNNVKSGRAYEDIRKSLVKLRSETIYILDREKGAMTITGWISEATFYTNGNIDVEISNKLKPYLLGLIAQGGYTQYELNDVVKLNNKHSIVLYKFMREADKGGNRLPTITGTIEEFKGWFNANPDMQFKVFNRDIIKVAVEEINREIPTMNLVVKQIKRGRSVGSLEITNTIPKSATVFANIHNDISIEENKEISEPVPMINWLKDLQTEK